MAAISDFPPRTSETAPDEVLKDDPREREGGMTAAQVEKLQLFSATLAVRRDEWVSQRSAAGHDGRWVEDLDQYNGEDAVNRAAANMMVSVEQGFPVTTHAAKATRSQVYVQVTRQKTNAAVARLSDIVLPTEERNFSIQPTPLPNMPGWVQTQMKPTIVPPLPSPAGGGGGNGSAPVGMGPMQGMAPGAQAMQGPQPTQMRPPGAEAPMSPPGGAPGGAPSRPQLSLVDTDPAKAMLLERQEEARKRALVMQDKIGDALDQCDYNAECRKVMFDAGVLGTGVLKGPVVLKTTKKSWRRTRDTSNREIWSLDVDEELAPASFRVDPRACYPDPACGEDIQDGRGHFELQQLTKKQVRELGKQPKYIRSQILHVLEEGPQPSKALRNVSDADRTSKDAVAPDLYDHWIYWGEIERDDLEAAGITLPEDELDTISACVEMINSTVVRAYLNPLPNGAIPYDYFPWERRPGTVWGYGVPYLMRSQQRVINAAWRMILDNAGVSSGPQIVVKPGLITPADQQWTLTARKIWYATDDVEDVSKAFATFEFNTHQQELAAIIEMAEKLTDAETAVPQMAQGEVGSAPETLGGMQMLMQSANVVLKRLVKQYDDYITKPHVRRYYDYLMQYDDDDQGKGDFQTVALGSSSLVVRDIQNQAITQMLQLAANPVFAPLINAKKLYEKALKAQHIDPVDIMNTEAEIEAIKQAQAEQAAQGGNDPRVAAATMRAQADMQRTQAQVQMNELVLKTKEGIAAADRQLDMERIAMERDIQIMQLAQERNLSIDQIKAQLAAVAIKTRAQADAEAQRMQIESGREAVNRIDQAEQTAQQTAAEQARAAQERADAANDRTAERLHQSQMARQQAQAERDRVKLQGDNAVRVAKAKPKPGAKRPGGK